MRPSECSIYIIKVNFLAHWTIRTTYIFQEAFGLSSHLVFMGAH